MSAPGQRVSRRVDLGEPGIGGVTVQLWRGGCTPAQGGTLVDTQVTDVNGFYLTPALPAGSYYLRTLNYGGYTDELCDDIPCSVHAELGIDRDLAQHPLALQLRQLGTDLGLE